MADPVKKIKAKFNANTLGLITLNVGDGDAIIIKFPTVNNKRTCAIIDCYDAKKTIAALNKIKPDSISFICATHPHYDHTKGIKKLLEWCIKKGIKIDQFWDSGFRHVSKTHYDIIKLLEAHPEIQVIYPTAGFECVINNVRVLTLSPSIHLKNRYDTFGTNINNASIVLKLEYPPKPLAEYYLSKEKLSKENLDEKVGIKQNTLILSGDAQFDAWARVTDDFPELRKTENRGQMINADEIKHRPLKCQLLKIPHHMSKHGISLEVLETLRPNFTVASCAKKSKHQFPHELTTMAVEDIMRKRKTKTMWFTGHPDKDKCDGTIVAMFQGSEKRPVICGLGETKSKNAPLPDLTKV